MDLAAYWVAQGHAPPPGACQPRFRIRLEAGPTPVAAPGSDSKFERDKGGKRKELGKRDL